MLGELIRFASSAAPESAKELVDQVLYKQVDLIWDDGETFMVLDKKLKATDKALLVLYRQDRLAVEDLRTKIDYRNKTTFRRILEELQKPKFIAITTDGYCKLSPLGNQLVENLILKT